MTDFLIIKKYPNRRLYNTETSAYITLEDVRDLVMKHIKFKVVDARSEEDMTSYVLLQIISEEEAGKFPIFNAELLQNIIRFYRTPLQKTVTRFLDQSLSSFTEQYDSIPMTIQKWQEQMANFFQQKVKESPLNEQEKPIKKPAKKNKRRKSKA